MQKFLTTYFFLIKMKKLLFSIFAVAVLLFSTSCNSYKQVPYFQNIDSISLAASQGLYDARIMPKDLLTITVSTLDPNAARPFNLIVSNTFAANNSLTTGQGSLQTYLVDNSGNINFPVIGKVAVQGLTKEEIQDLLAEKIKPYLSATENPIVTVKMASYRVTVLGEVARPGVIPVTTEKMSILEALAQAGDLTIYGRRDNVILLREDATGQKHHVRLNLNDANLINSPYYYLQQNDQIYVEPNKVKAKTSEISQSTTIWFTLTGTLVSLASLIVNIARK